LQIGLDFSFVDFQPFIRGFANSFALFICGFSNFVFAEVRIWGVIFICGMAILLTFPKLCFGKFYFLSEEKIPA
jgi:hypothetical protein